MSIRERVRDRIDEIKETVGDYAMAIAARLYGESELHIFSAESLAMRDLLSYRAGVEAGKVAAGEPDLFLMGDPIDE